MHNHGEMMFVILTEKLTVTLRQMEREIKEIRYKTIRSCKIKLKAMKKIKFNTSGNNSNLPSKNVGYCFSQNWNVAVERCPLRNF